MNVAQSAAAGFALGLLSAGHCLGMCGPVAFFVGSGQNAASRGRLARLAPYFWLCAGKALTYAWIGLLFGYAGHLLTRWSQWMGLSRLLPLVSGGSMVLAGLWIAGLLPKPAFRAGVLEQKVSEYLRSFKRRQTPPVLFAAGMVWGFLPCPMVLVPALASAVQGGVSGAQGALHGFFMMAGFGAGTFPALAAAGLGGDWTARLRGRLSPLWAGLCLAGFGAALIGFYWTSHANPHSTCCPL